MSNGLETLVVLIANGITATLASALLLLLLWQAPGRRLNQALALTMFCLAAYSALNGVSRFADLLRLPVSTVYYTLLSLYGCFTLALFVFILLISELRTPWRRWLLWYGIIAMPVVVSLTWAGYLVVDPYLTPSGSIAFRYGPLYIPGFLATAIPPIISVWIMLRSNYPHKGMIIVALLFTFLGVFTSPLRAILGSIPLNALGLTVTTYIIGRTVFRSQVFNPLVEMNKQLQRKNIALQEEGQLKSVFMANISRDLRTPLNAVIVYSSMAVEGAYGAFTPKQRDRMQKVYANSQHLLSVVNDILDLNQIETGNLPITLGTFPVSAIVEPTWELIEPLADKKGLRLERDIQPRLPMLRVDEQRARQILNNLLSNAIKFTPTGYVRLRVRKVPEGVRFEVEDSGIGIPADQRDHIFEPFVQVDSSATREFGGTGLGLAISLKLVKMQGGQLGFTSTVGRGSTFYVCFASV